MKLLKRRSRSSNGDIFDHENWPDNRLAFVDHAMFAMRPPGGETVVQFLWVYEHPIDFDRLRRFHRNLDQGMLARRIERSPLPFARHRWVSGSGSDIDIAERARPRGELSDWADARAQLTIDSVSGPGWRLGVAPFTDGSAAVSLEASHFLVDGVGLTFAIVDALQGNTRDLGYPPPGSRTRFRAVLQDLGQTAQDTPEIIRALATVVKLARRRPPDVARKPASRRAPISGDGDEVVVIPGLTILVVLDEWDKRAEALGGTSTTLLAGLAAKLAEHMGRRRSDGTVTVQLPVNERTEGDYRANALAFVRISVDPTQVTTDLRDVRASVKEAVRTARQTPDSSSHALPLILLMPKRTLKRMATTADPELPVICSHLGDIDPIAGFIDGTEAEYTTARAVGQRLTRQTLEQLGGVMGLVLWRVHGKATITITAYQPGAQNTKPALSELVAHALAEFGLTGEVD